MQPGDARVVAKHAKASLYLAGKFKVLRFRL